MPTLPQKCAIYVKANESVFRVLGVVFFLITAMAGVLWLFGRDVESVAFVLGCISSSMFGVIEVAKFVVPDRKAVREMTIDQLLQLVELSSAATDWMVFTSDTTTEAASKEDPRLRVTVHHDERGIHQEDFREPWANGFPDPKAVSYWADITYDRALIDRRVLVSVDGGRAMLPMPQSRVDLKVNKLHYRIAELLDGMSTLPDYFSRAGLRVDA
jgi:hypothetical protein